MKVVLTGSSGLIGPHLTHALRSDGHDVVRLVRRPPSAPDEARWDPGVGTVDPVALSGADAVINLAGPGMGDRPWTPSYKAYVLEARVDATTTISKAMAASTDGPRTLLSASGVGYYGNPGDVVVTEGSPRGSTYVAEVAGAWEDATSPASDAGIRVVRLRTGVVVTGKGGAFGRLLPIFRLGLGGKLGSGRAWWSWVALSDYIEILRFLLADKEIEGPVNVTAPHPLRNADLTKAIGHVLHRPTVLTVPGFALKAPLREFAEDLLGGQRAEPGRLQDAGYEFRYPSFETALRAELDRSATS